MGLISNTVYISVYIHTDRLYIHVYIVGLVQERRNSIANALELRLSCTNPSIYYPCLSIYLSDKHSQSHPSVLRATHPSLHEFTATLTDSSILLSFHIATLSSSLLSFWDPTIQPCVQPFINYPIRNYPHPPSINYSHPPSLLSIHPFIIFPFFRFHQCIKTFNLQSHFRFSFHPTIYPSIHPSYHSLSFFPFHHSIKTCPFHLPKHLSFDPTIYLSIHQSPF